MRKLFLISLILLVSIACVGSVSAITWTSANGCWTGTNGAYTVVMWNATGFSTWTIPAGVTQLQYLVIAGGAGGSGDTSSGVAGGAGGSGGLLANTTGSLLSVTPGSVVAVAIGTGGNGYYSRESAPGSSFGSNSSFANTTPGNGINAEGGGPGSAYGYGGSPGGSGGGSASEQTASGGSGVAGQGYAGGSAVGTGSAGNGGGSSSAGTSTSTSGSTYGGNGTLNSITGVSTCYAGGGGAGSDGSYNAGLGGICMGGLSSGATGGSNIPSNAASNSGSGGGGKNQAGGAVTGGNGGSGIVIISYLSTSPPVASYTISNITGINTAVVNFTDTSTNSPTSWQWGYKNVTGNNTWVNGPTTEFPTIIFGGGNWTTNLTATNTGGSNTFQNLTFVNVSVSPPITSFVGTPTSGASPLTVTFNDTSSGSPTSWLWGFRNETPGNNTWINGPSTRNITQILTTGTWDINLTATNAGGGNTSTMIGYISVSGVAPPISSFTANQTTYTDYPMTVQFTDTSTGSPTAWNYSFGDTYTSTSQNPVHVYTVAGNYTVTMNSSNAYGVGSNVIGYINLTSDVDSNLKSWMHFNTSTTMDLQGNAWLATGNPTISGSTYKFGGGSVGFTANNQYISSASSTIWNLGGPSQSDELEFWIYVNSLGSSGRTIISRESGTANNNGWGLVNGGSTSTYGFYMGAIVNETPTFTISNSVWHHIAVSLNSTYITIYEDGSVVSQGTRPTGSYDVSQPIIIGNNQGGSPSFYIDEFRMSTNTPRFTTVFSPPYMQYQGNLYFVYPNINTNATLLYKSYPNNATTVYNITPHVRTVQIQNVTNITSLVATINFPTQWEISGTPMVNTTGAITYPDLQITGISIDNTNGETTFNVSRSGGGGINSTFLNRTSLVDIPFTYYNYSTATNFTTFFSNATLTDGQHSVSYPITNFYSTPVPLGTWTIYSSIVANATTVGVGSPIQFTDNSLGEPAGWTTYGWTFGDGGTSTMQNPLYTYGAIGNYTVTYTSSLVANSSVTNTTYMYINVTTAPPPAPVASFTSSTQVAAVGSPIQFTDTSTNSPTSWMWAFGDGSGSSLQNPSHAYSLIGNYTVNLTATNSQGSNTLSQTNYIQIKSSISGFTRQDLTMAPQYVLTLKVVDSVTNLPIPSCSLLDSDGGNYTTSTGTFSLTYPYSTVVVYVSSSGYTSASASYVISGSQSQTIQLTKTTTTSAQNTVWYVPKTIDFHVVDQYGNYLTGANVSAQFNTSSTLLGGYTDLVNWYGMNPTAANEAANGTLSMYGYSDTMGDIVFTMLSTLQYNVYVTYGGVTNVFYIHPQDSIYQLKFVGIAIPDTSLQTCVVGNGNTYTFATTNITNQTATMGWSYQDTCGLTTAVDYYVNLTIPNTAPTTLYHYTLTPVTTGVYKLSYTVPNVRTYQYQWYELATRSV